MVGSRSDSLTERDEGSLALKSRVGPRSHETSLSKFLPQAQGVHFVSSGASLHALATGVHGGGLRLVFGTKRQPLCIRLLRPEFCLLNLRYTVEGPQRQILSYSICKRRQ